MCSKGWNKWKGGKLTQFDTEHFQVIQVPVVTAGHKIPMLQCVAKLQYSDLKNAASQPVPGLLHPGKVMWYFRVLGRIQVWMQKS